MIRRKNFNSMRVPAMSDAFPQAVIANNLIFLSGTPGLDPATGQVVSSDFEQQLRQSFTNIKMILEDAGSGLSKILKTTIFMVAGNDFAVVKQDLQRIFPGKCAGKKYSAGNAFPRKHTRISRMHCKNLTAP